MQVGKYSVCLVSVVWMIHLRFAIAEAQKIHKNYLEAIGKALFNNMTLSDVTFEVNGNQYYVTRTMMSAASEKFNDMLKENQNDRFILNNIKYNESFENILKIIHGYDINLNGTSDRVLCEMIHLADLYKLNDLHRELTDHFSQLEEFSVESITVMLNTAKTYNLSNQYENLTIYVYQHACEVVNHASIVQLNFDVLMDLLKSDWLYCQEIDILKAVLKWYDTIAVETSVETQNRTNELEETSFSILKNILSLIRFGRISMSDFFNSMKSEIFIKYKDNIIDRSFNIMNSKERILYSTKLKRFVTFTFKNMSHVFKSKHEDDKYSEERYTVGKHIWTLDGQTSVMSNKKYFGIYLRCLSLNDNFNVTASFQLNLLGKEKNETISALSKQSIYTKSVDNRGSRKFINFSNLFNSSQNYIIDDKMTVAVLISVSSEKLSDCDSLLSWVYC